MLLQSSRQLKVLLHYKPYSLIHSHTDYSPMDTSKPS